LPDAALEIVYGIPDGNPVVDEAQEVGHDDDDGCRCQVGEGREKDGTVPMDISPNQLTDTKRNPNHDQCYSDYTSCITQYRHG